MLHEPDVVEADAVGEHALLDRLFIERVPVDARALERSLCFVEQAESHGLPLRSGGLAAILARPRDHGPCIAPTFSPTTTSISVSASTSSGVKPGATSSSTKRVLSQRSSARSVTT